MTLNNITNTNTEELQEELFESHHIQCTSGVQPIRIDKYLHNHLPNISRHKIQNAIKMSWVQVNQKPVKNSYKVRPFDDILVHTPNISEQEEVIPQDIKLNIVFEDEYLFIVNKPAGMVVHPGFGNYNNTLLNGVAYYLKSQLGSEALTLDRFGMVHRIDKETSGLLVISKTPEASADLGKQFFNHTIEREYIGLVWGDVKSEHDTIVGHIGRHQHFRKLFECYENGEQGKHAVTHYRVLERFGFTTLLSFRLETGRTHQIRVHMSHIGHPIFMDKLYGGNSIKKGVVFSKYKQFVENAFNLCQRQALHAKRLGFVHPIKKTKINLECPLPEDMQAIIEKWRNYNSSLVKNMD